MNIEEFKNACTEVVDYIADYRDSVGEREVIPDTEPGFAKKIFPLEAPEQGEKWEEIMQDLENFILPNILQWIHPQFHAYFPLGASNASILGIMICCAINCSSNTWSECPASTELEMVLLDWIASLFTLPDKFHFYKKGSKGGGVLQGSASECTLMCLYTAQRSSLQKLKEKNPGMTDQDLLSLQIAYMSSEAHSSVEKAGMIALVNIRILDADEEYKFRGETLEKAIKSDIEKGLHPFFCAATFGTSSCAAVDRIDELGPICKKYDLWFHVDGAYALAALSCPEFRHFLQGFEYVTSVNTNPNKWLLIHYDCCIMWVEDRHRFASAISDPSEIHEYPNTPVVDYDTWGIVDIRRFRALKMWYMLRIYGVHGIQKYIRNHVVLANHFYDLVIKDDRFEVKTKMFGLVCFRLKGSNSNSAKLLAAITSTNKLFMVPTTLNGVYAIRFCVDNEYATEEHINYAWQVIKGFADGLNFPREPKKESN